MDHTLQAPKSPQCMGCDYGLRVNILEEGEESPGRSCIINHVAKLNNDGEAETTTDTNIARQIGFMIMGGTGHPQPPPRSAHSMQRFLREVKNPDDGSYGTEYWPVPAVENNDDKEEFCLKFWENMRKCDSTNRPSPDAIKDGTAYLEKHIPECVWSEHNQSMEEPLIPVAVYDLPWIFMDRICKNQDQQEKFLAKNNLTPKEFMKQEKKPAPFDKYAEILAITTMINEEAGVMGWDINGHSGTFGIKCPICSEYLTEDEPKKKQ